MRSRAPSVDAAPSTAIDAAAYWRVRHDRGDMTAPDAEQLERWRAASPAHEAAWQATTSLWEALDDAGDAHLDAMRVAAQAAGRRERFRPRSVAAALAIVAIPAGLLGLAQLGRHGVGNPAAPAPASRYETHRGQRATMTLADGTIVSLDSDTELAVTLDRTGRHVTLTRGQALFKVAKDPHRPFVLRARDGAVTALGTVFNVKVAPRVLRVVLVEGRVAVDTGNHRRSSPVVLTPGQELLVDRSGTVQVSAVDPDAALLWLKGLIEFNDITLADAIEELNVTSARPLRLADQRLGTLRLSGIYRTGAPDQFVDSISQILPVTRRKEQDGVVIAPRKKISD